MASKLQEEVICPICIEILQDPVTIDCGHNFCLECISQVGKAARTLLCPLCKASVNRNTFRPNKLLSSLTEKIQAMEVEEAELRCQSHKEKLYYFCEQDGELLCVLCRESKGHKSHRVSLIEEAAQTYQGKIQSRVEVLEQKEKEMLEDMTQGENMIWVFRTRVHLERLKTLEEFKLLWQSLKEEESFLLARLGWLEQEGVKHLRSFGTDTQEQLSSLRKLTESLKVKQQMPPRQLLQDIKLTLSRSDRFQFTYPTPAPRDLPKNINEVKLRHDSVIESLKKFKDKLQADGKTERIRFLDSLKEKDKESWYLFEVNNAESPTSATPTALLEDGRRASYGEFPVDGVHPEDVLAKLPPVTLDASSAHLDLILSKDLKTVKLDRRAFFQVDTILPNDPQHFHPCHCVLGSPGISCGQRIWEMELQVPKERVTQFNTISVVGVAKEPVPRQGCPRVKPLEGFWMLRITNSECCPVTDNDTTAMFPVPLRKVGIFVDHDFGKVVFYDPDTNNHIYTFHTSFNGQVFPFFWLLAPDVQITLSP